MSIIYLINDCYFITIYCQLLLILYNFTNLIFYIDFIPIYFKITLIVFLIIFDLIKIHNSIFQLQYY